MGIDCALGGVKLVHWLAPDPNHPGRFHFTDEPYVWEHEGEAHDALEAYRTQQEG
jgi:hypothetical protein